MNLFSDVLKYDLRDRFKRVSTYIYFSLFFIFSVILVLAGAGAFPGVQVNFSGSNRVDINSPLTIQALTLIISFFSVFVIAPIFGQNAFKDHLNNFNELTHSKSFNRNTYFFVRFLSAFIVSFFILSSIGLGLYVGSLLPWVDEAYLGPFQLFAYIKPYLTGVFPNLIVFGGIFFFMGSFFKRMTFVYVSGAAVFLGWMLSGQLGGDLENYMLSALTDPSGMRASSLVVRYWTAAQQNSQFVPLESFFLYNRILWTLVGLSFLGLARLFYERIPSRSSKKKKREKIPSSTAQSLHFKDISFVEEKRYGFSEFVSLTKHEFLQSIKHPVVVTLLLLGCGYIFLLSPNIGKMFGTPTLPVTYKVVDMLGAVFSLFILIILTFWSGEMLWKERGNNFDEIVDSSPVSLMLLKLPKLVALNLLLFVLFLLLTVCGIIIQSFKGYYNFEVGLYLQQFFFVHYPAYFGMSCLAFLAHALINNKFIAHGAMILYYIYLVYGSSFGIERNIFRINSSPTILYSDMNGFGPNLYGHIVFSTMWGFLSILFAALAVYLCQRGKEGALRERLSQLKEKFHGRLRWVSVFLVLIFASLWAYAYYNTSVLNEFQFNNDRIRARVEYEKNYREKWLYAPRPDFTKVDVEFHLYPEERRAEGTGKFIITNRFEKPMSEVLLSLPKIHFQKMTIEGGFEILKDNEALGIQVIKLKKALMPGEKRKLTYEYEIKNQGFENEENDTSIVKNGTFINGRNIFPSFGYDMGLEESNIKERRRYGLGEQTRVLDIDNPVSSKYTYLAPDAMKIEFNALVSTSEDQVIVAPGYLKKEWQEKGRYYAQYHTDTPILHFYSFLSARYEVVRDQWKDVKIEVFHHKGHDKNVDQMIASAKESLAYFSKNFSPYQYRQFRIFEFPRYQTFAQAFPNTIPFSEGIGFIAELEDEDSIDYPFYITSHELAHQWFGHQLVGGLVPGATMLVESLAQYGALMVMEKHFGKDHMKKFLKYELNRYLRGRSQEIKEEMPLARNENQGYIHYQKASLVLYRLKEEIGEEKLNIIIANFIARYGLEQEPKLLPHAQMLVSEIKAQVPDKAQLIDELFNQIVLYENRVMKAEKEVVSEGQYKVTLKLNLKKIKATPEGEEKFVDFNEEIPIGVRNKEGEFIYYQPHRLKNGEQTLELKLSEEPFQAGVDPLNTFIDKSVKDNEVWL